MHFPWTFGNPSHSSHSSVVYYWKFNALTVHFCRYLSLMSLVSFIFFPLFFTCCPAPGDMKLATLSVIWVLALPIKQQNGLLLHPGVRCSLGLIWSFAPSHVMLLRCHVSMAGCSNLLLHSRRSCLFSECYGRSWLLVNIATFFDLKNLKTYYATDHSYLPHHHILFKLSKCYVI